MEWYDRAKALMKQRSITQASLCKLFCVSTRGAVGHYLTGRREPSVKQINDLSRALGCSIDYLVNGHDSGDSNKNNISPEHRNLITMFSGLSDAKKEILISTMMLLSDETAANTSKTMPIDNGIRKQ